MVVENVTNVLYKNDYIQLNNKNDEKLWCGSVRYIPLCYYERMVYNMHIKVLGGYGILILLIEE